MQFAWLHRPEVFNKYQLVVKNANDTCKVIYDMVDFHYLRLIRHWEQNKDFKLKADADKNLQTELENCKNADIIIVISKEDKDALMAHYSDSNKMVVIGNIHQFISKGLDFKPYQQRQNLLFVGGFKHLPNVDAVFYLHDEIMPLVWKHNPDIVVEIVGSYPTDEMLLLHSEKFNIIGFVEIIENCYKKARLFVAPLRYGAGIKGKIGQSLEHSLPVITSAVGAEGFNFSPYKDFMVADTAEAFASQILQLYSDENLWIQISENSEKIISPFATNHIENQLKSLLKIEQV